jgi:hypothetical protein
MESMAEIATRGVHAWLIMRGLDDPVCEEPVAMVRSGTPFPDAAEFLKRWFEERLLLNPGVTGPFQDLAYMLMDAMLDQVDWQAIVGVMRRRED